MADQHTQPNDFFNFFAKDRRFRDEAWSDSSLFQNIKDAYLTYQNFIISMVDQIDMPFWEKRKVSFWTKTFLDACSPSNFPLTNPEVLRQTTRQQGNNFIRGMQNFWNDMAQNPHVFPPLTDTSAFQLGENIANTPGDIVFQNDVFQLIQYHPVKSVTHEAPLLLIPAWVNKYYLFDLSETKSFVRFNLEKGRTVFCVSWINPTSEQHYLTMRDYLDRGIETAIRQVHQINQKALAGKIQGDGAINIVAICVGGTFLLTKLAELAVANQTFPIASITLLMTPFDFEYLEWAHFFISDTWLQDLRNKLELSPQNKDEYGIIVGETIMRMFCCLRANDLIWPNYVDRYLLGNALSPIDFLYWNHDAPCVPIRMLCDYIEEFFIRNAFVSQPIGAMTDDDQKRNDRCALLQAGISKITIPAFIFGTERDHIVPWESCYKAAQSLPNSKFVLGGAGHVVGCINPPSSHKYHYFEIPNEGVDTPYGIARQCGPLAWLNQAQKQAGSWWLAWDRWVQIFDSKEVPSWKADAAQIIESAPGKYAIA